jgi:NitT/TauT family transport system substrate-binding protein
VVPTPAVDPSAIFVKAGSPISSAQDLSGKKVAVNALKAILQLVTDVSIDHDGGASTSTQYVAMPFAQMEGALAAGDVDAAVVIEPFQTALEKKGFTRIDNPFTTALHPGDALSVYFTSAAYAKTHKSDLTKFVAAMDKAVVYAKGNPEYVRRLIPTYSGIPADAVKAMRINEWSGAIAPDGLQRMVDLMVKYKFVDKAPAVDSMMWKP